MNIQEQTTNSVATDINCQPLFQGSAYRPGKGQDFHPSPNCHVPTAVDITTVSLKASTHLSGNCTGS